MIDQYPKDGCEQRRAQHDVDRLKCVNGDTRHLLGFHATGIRAALSMSEIIELSEH